MALVSGRSSSSTLNPNAPLFIPAAFRQVEDFSPAWWKLITTSTWYHDYWISQNPDCLSDPAENNDVLDLLPDSIDLGAGDDFSFMEEQFEEFIQYSEAEAKAFSPMGGKGLNENNAIALKSMDSNGLRSKEQYQAKYLEKPAKNVIPKYSPRSIQQPR